MNGILRDRTTIDDFTGKPIKEAKKIETLYIKSTKRSDVVEFFKDMAKIINEIDD